MYPSEFLTNTRTHALSAHGNGLGNASNSANGFECAKCNHRNEGASTKRDDDDEELDDEELDDDELLDEDDEDLDDELHDEELEEDEVPRIVIETPVEIESPCAASCRSKLA